MNVVFEVEGRPVPQGSMTASYNKKLGVAHVHHVQGEALALWRASIRTAARESGATISRFPIAVWVEFGMPRPKTHMWLKGGQYRVRPMFWDALPSVQPDIDKLARAVCDALTGVCYNDDAQIVKLLVTKVYGSSTSITITDEIPRAQQEFSFGMG